MRWALDARLGHALPFPPSIVPILSYLRISIALFHLVFSQPPLLVRVYSLLDISVPHRLRNPKEVGDLPCRPRLTWKVYQPVDNVSLISLTRPSGISAPQATRLTCPTKSAALMPYDRLMYARAFCHASTLGVPNRQKAGPLEARLESIGLLFSSFRSPNEYGSGRISNLT
jgi:hypothetical protein